MSIRGTARAYRGTRPKLPRSWRGPCGKEAPSRDAKREEVEATSTKYLGFSEVNWQWNAMQRDNILHRNSLVNFVFRPFPSRLIDW